MEATGRLRVIKIATAPNDNQNAADKTISGSNSNNAVAEMSKIVSAEIRPLNHSTTVNSVTISTVRCAGISKPAKPA